jgi:HK97 family phage prohead protease
MAEATLDRYTPDSRIGEPSAKQLRAIIAAVSRGAALDKVRAQVVARAEQLDKRGLLPDNWRSDGTLKATAATWATDEQRETWSDLRTGLQSALDEKYDTTDDWCYWIWVQDFTDTEVIFCKGDTLYSAPYTVIDCGPIEIGDATTVRPITQYVNTEAARKGGPLLEFRRQKVANLKGLERRTFAAADMELREADDGMLHFTGYASVTDVPYDVGWYQETIQRGAFKRTLGEKPDVQLLINHAGMPLARTISGTMTLTEDDRGLKVEADLDPEDPDVQSLARKMKRGDIDQMSFAFMVTAGDWNDDYSARTITACSIHRGDVSVVNQGANPASTASVRSQDAIAALRRLGGTQAYCAMMMDWRAWTLLPDEQRAGKALSTSTMEVLTRVLELTAGADEALDEVQPLLAELMGVPNPDEPEPDVPDDGATRAIVIPDHLTRARQEIAVLTAGRRS